MNAITKEEQTALTLPQRAAVALGESANITKLRELAAKSSGIVTVTNADGREEAHRAGMVLRSTRTSITSTGKAAREDATAFSKAVIALEKELIAVIEPEEVRVLALRDGFDAEEKARMDALIAAERARVEAIQKSIQLIRDLPLTVVGATAEVISAMLDATQKAQPGPEFEELIEQAQIARNETIDKLTAALVAKVAAEEAAAATEQARIAEAARIEAERAELARQRVENERIANEQAAERKRLADAAAAQGLAAAQQREAAAANERADAEARAKAQREADAALKAKEDAINAKIAAHEAAIKLEADHGEALAMNAQIDADRIEQARLDGLAQEAAAQDLARCTETAQAMLTNGRSLIQESASVSAYVDAGLDVDRSEGRIDDLGEIVRDLLAMHYTADEIRAMVEAAMVPADLEL
jgi:hypothetical protein